MEEKKKVEECIRKSKCEEEEEWKAWKKKVKELVDESKMRVDEEFGRKLSE